MDKVKVITTVHECLIEVEVDRKELAEKLSLGNEIAKSKGLRPGQPLNSLSPSDIPSSKETLNTRFVIIETQYKQSVGLE